MSKKKEIQPKKLNNYFKEIDLRKCESEFYNEEHLFKKFPFGL